jgi:hypothetical protein
MATVTIYVGSNNDTGELELEKIEKILNSRHDGYTLYRATGYWHGDREDSAVITVADSWASIRESITDLKAELNQQAIAYHYAPDLQFA